MGLELAITLTCIYCKYIINATLCSLIRHINYKEYIGKELIKFERGPIRRDNEKSQEGPIFRDKGSIFLSFY